LKGNVLFFNVYNILDSYQEFYGNKVFTKLVSLLISFNYYHLRKYILWLLVFFTSFEFIVKYLVKIIQPNQIVPEISNSHEQMMGFQRMMQLLPVINRDTLYVLLQFLGLVAENSEDRKADDGKPVYSETELMILIIWQETF
jgi:hypothetical protein